ITAVAIGEAGVDRVAGRDCREGRVSECVFKVKFRQRWNAGKLICVGLDPDLSRIPVGFDRKDPADTVVGYMCAIVDATAEFANSFKAQSAFYEALGLGGPEALHAVVGYLQRHYPDIATILDAKRGDNANSNRGYVESIFDWHGFDAVTVHN